MKKLYWGENPYQVPAHLVTQKNNKDPLAINSFQQLSGERPCFTNLADLDSIINSLTKISLAFKGVYHKTPFICVAAKHGNPCGASIDWDNSQNTVEKALWTNPLAIWGGEVITNFPIDKEIANLLLTSSKRKETLGNANWMLDIVAAPEFSKEAIEILGKRPQRKLLANKTLTNPSLPPNKWMRREVRGGFLRQPSPNYILDLKEVNWIIRPLNDNHGIDSLIIAWAVAYTSNHGGNEVALAKNQQLIGVGGGPSTVEAARIAITRAKDGNFDTSDSVFAADAFFPYTDAPELLFKTGCKEGLVPAGGKNEQMIKDYFRANDMAVGFIPEKYRGFCRH